MALIAMAGFPFSAKRGRWPKAGWGAESRLDRRKFAETVAQSGLGRSGGPHPIRPPGLFDPPGVARRLSGEFFKGKGDPQHGAVGPPPRRRDRAIAAARCRRVTFSPAPRSAPSSVATVEASASPSTRVRAGSGAGTPPRPPGCGGRRRRKARGRSRRAPASPEAP